MIEEFDKLRLTPDDTDGERKEKARKRKEILAKMGEDELDELLKRPYPSQFKAVIKSYKK